jgi:hypothetical protein
VDEPAATPPPTVGALPLGFVRHRGWVADVAEITPSAAVERNQRATLRALEAAGIAFFHVPQGRYGATVAIDGEDRSAFVAALREEVADVPFQVAPLSDRGRAIVPPTRVAELTSEDLAAASVLRIVRSSFLPGNSLLLGPDYGCDVELWTRTRDGDLLAPRANLLSDEHVPASLATIIPDPGPLTPGPTLEVFRRRPFDRIAFPIDVVYLWVDGGDPDWAAKKRRAMQEVSATTEMHEDAADEVRFRSRDELRYSLRSLDMFAPWVRKVYLVTDDQVPTWLDPAAADLELISHRDIFPSEWLPIFNSHAISSRLHRIQGLGEHYLTMNDDVFLGRPMRPERFFTPSGLARCFLSSVRIGPGTPSATDLPHEGAQKAAARLVERDYGVSPTRAFFHAPHPQLRSLHQELEGKYPDAYERTGRSRFRDPLDYELPGTLHHYVGMATGRSLPGSIRYAYVNAGLHEHRARMVQLMRSRSYDTFCLNDVAGGDPDVDTHAILERFMRTYFPVPSRWERRAH